MNSLCSLDRLTLKCPIYIAPSNCQVLPFSVHLGSLLNHAVTLGRLRVATVKVAILAVTRRRQTKPVANAPGSSPASVAKSP